MQVTEKSQEMNIFGGYKQVFLETHRLSKLRKMNYNKLEGTFVDHMTKVFRTKGQRC